MPRRVVPDLKLPPLDRGDSLLSGVDAIHLDRWNANQAAGHVSRSLIVRHGTVRLFVADSLLKLWSASLNPVTGNRHLGQPTLLNDDRFRAVVRALDEYSPKQIANAIRAYGRHCQTDPERIKKPEMRLGFDKFLRTSLEVWVNVGSRSALDAQRAEQQVNDVREHREFLAAWSQLSPDRQTELLRKAGSTFTAANPTTSNPAFRAVLRALMEAREAGSGKREAAKQTGEPPQAPGPSPEPLGLLTIEQLHAAWDAMSKADQAKLLEKAEKRLLAQGKFAGRRSMAVPILRTKVYQILQQDLRRRSPLCPAES